MKPNEIIGAIGFLMWATSFLTGALTGNIWLALAQFFLGANIQTAFLSWWGLETFNKYFD